MRSILEMLGRRAELVAFCASQEFAANVEGAADVIVQTLGRGNKVLVFGNGGSAAEAQHFAAELVGKFERDRRPLPVIALTTDASILTAQANDAGYKTVFARQVEALVQPFDIVVGLTTSDATEHHSRNIREAFHVARAHQATTVCLGSNRTIELLKETDIAVLVPDDNTARVQEVHLMILHTISAIVENTIN